MLLLSLILMLAPAPTPPPSSPFVEFDFSAVPLKRGQVQGQEVDIRLELVAADGQIYRDGFGLWQDGTFEYRRDRQGVDVTEDLVKSMGILGIKAEVTPDKNTVRVTGWPTKDGTPRAVVLGRVWACGLPPDQFPRVKNPPPPPVEFDLSPIPLKPGGKLTLSFEVSPADGAGDPVRVEAEYEQLQDRYDLAEEVAGRFTKAGLKAEATGSRVRVFGWMGKDGKLRPAAAGRVKADDLKRADLPRVTGLPPALPSVVFDLGPLPPKPARDLTIRFEATTAKPGKSSQGEIRYRTTDTPTDAAAALADRLVRDGFYAERDGAKVRVYNRTGSYKPDKGVLELFPATGGKVECKDLKPEELPKVTNPKKQP